MLFNHVLWPKMGSFMCCFNYSCLFKYFPHYVHSWGQAAKAAYHDFERMDKNGCSIDKYWDNIVEYLISAQDLIMKKSGHTFPTVETKPVETNC